VAEMKIKAVLFDLGNTLVKTWNSEVTYKNVLASLGIDRSIEELEKAIAKTEEEFKESNYRSRYGEVSYTEYWERWDAQVLTYLGVSGEENLARQVKARWFDHANCVAYPEAVVTLNRLKLMDLKLGLISTAYEEDINAILERSGLEKRLFDIVVGVNTIKKEKPHPDVFRHALSKLNIEPSETLFVGDHIDNDYRGAKAVGIHALLIEREGKSTDDTSNLDRVRSLQDIFRFIE
jgi:putative hydrolase of the HAD superfamily